MCGIVGYTGSRQALPLVVQGLRRLEYRGYDSSGVAVLDGAGGLTFAKKAGVLANLERHLASGLPAVSGRAGIGYTRWVTHGGPTVRNAHPHSDGSGKVAVVHNGIIENFVALRADLESTGTVLRSDTDTEVVAHRQPDIGGHTGGRGIAPEVVVQDRYRAVRGDLDGVVEGVILRAGFGRCAIPAPDRRPGHLAGTRLRRRPHGGRH